MWAVAENGADSWNPGSWSKYDWTENSGEVYYCQSTFAAETEADALSADSANATDLDTGCGGFPWSQMDHALMTTMIKMKWSAMTLILTL